MKECSTGERKRYSLITYAPSQCGHSPDMTIKTSAILPSKCATITTTTTSRTTKTRTTIILTTTTILPGNLAGCTSTSLLLFSTTSFFQGFVKSSVQGSIKAQEASLRTILEGLRVRLSTTCCCVQVRVMLTSGCVSA